ncbi:MAG: hypothetical protein K2K68_06820 [Duncaniella sp.]|nr:hypothetical protein [Duncaniella sp.]
MILRYLFSLLIIITAAGGDAQSLSDFKVEKIEKQVSDFRLDSIDLSSPLNYYLSRAQVRLSGKFRNWQNISSSMFDYSANVPDEIITDDFRNYVLNEHIDYIVTYRDSVASIITHNEGEDIVMLNNCWLENGKWVNRGQGVADDLNKAEDALFIQLPEALYDLPRIAVINDLPGDVTPFLAYISEVELSPEMFLLEMLKTNKIVISGEYHRRKVSWDMLKRLIELPDFSDAVGCIFMELPSWHQSTMDTFLNNDTINSNLIFQIFQDEQLNGWWDRGEYEFLCQLWELNHSLPDAKKIKVILADYQPPYSKISTKEEARELEDRNTHMANVVINTIQNSTDKRSNLFLVGCAHAYKSNQSGIASAAFGKENELTAGAQIANALGSDKVFTVFQHVMPGDNHGGNKTAIRGGIFDKAFELNGNKPIGFKLADSPFGAEPFDGIYEIKYKTASGSYADNFDGYLFLTPVADEPKAKPLTEIFTDDFVAEMQRRALVLECDNLRHIWFGRRASDLTKEYIIETFSQE